MTAPRTILRLLPGLALLAVATSACVGEVGTDPSPGAPFDDPGPQDPGGDGGPLLPDAGGGGPDRASPDAVARGSDVVEAPDQVIVDRQTPAPSADALPVSGPDADPPHPPAIDWRCDDSEYQGRQFWTCNGGALYRCQAGGLPARLGCDDGCRVGPVGTDDVCSIRSAGPTSVPALRIVIRDGLFAESAVRAPLEEGLAYALERIYSRVAVGPERQLPGTLTLSYGASGNSYCSGQAFAESTDLSCPYGYPVTGSNQNYVVNISIHELGHILALHLIASASVRDTCTNEGLASWIAGRYWMNHRSQPVDSLREAARGAIAEGVAPSMRSCVSASDRHYKIYASFFEYLDQNVAGGLLEVATGRSALDFEAAWLAWLR